MGQRKVDGSLFADYYVIKLSNDHGSETTRSTTVGIVMTNPITMAESEVVEKVVGRPTMASSTWARSRLCALSCCS